MCSKFARGSVNLLVCSKLECVWQPVVLCLSVRVFRACHVDAALFKRIDVYKFIFRCLMPAKVVVSPYFPQRLLQSFSMKK